MPTPHDFEFLIGSSQQQIFLCDQQIRFMRTAKITRNSLKTLLMLVFYSHMSFEITLSADFLDQC
jgi:hypothetical protein